MERCLQVPEILRLICDQIPTCALTQAEEQRSLYSTALSCRAFLEPALDNLWYTLRSFKPIAACLPKDLLKSEPTRFRANESPKFTLLSLKRVIISADLERYLTYYAPRIRIVEPKFLKAIFSVDAWQGLQLVTHFKPGVLAPFNTKLDWSLNGSQCPFITPNLLAQSYAYFSLFLGESTSSLSFCISSKTPIHLASINSALSGPAHVKKLHIVDTDFSSRNVYIDQHIMPRGWDCLEDLRISAVPQDSLSTLASLPRLFRLEVDGLLDVQTLDYTYDSNAASNRLSALSGATVFTALRHLALFSSEYDHFSGVLQLIPPTNRLVSLKCVITEAYDFDDTQDCENLALTILHHCNRDTLRKLVIRDLLDPMDLEDDEDVDDDKGRYKLQPFLSFSNLETVHLDMRHQVHLVPEDIEDIISSWPKLKKLKIDVNLPSSDVPYIGAADFLNLIYNCPHLEKLGLRMNMTRVGPSNDARPSFARYDDPAPLTKLWVGDSPIIHPGEVARFLGNHCPKLCSRYLCFLSEDEVGTETSWFRPIYSRRWATVHTLTGY